MTTILSVLLAWAIAAAVVMWLIARAELTEPAPARPADPFEGEMIEWRRRVHDWTRDN